MIMSSTEGCEIGSVPLPDISGLMSTITSFSQKYGELHPYIALFLCITGIILNLITVIVLSRRTMLSPVNILLCSIAICDGIVMMSYLIFVAHFLIKAASRCESSDYNYHWAVFTLFHAHASVIFHSTSIWLTVSLAQIRVLMIRRVTVTNGSIITIYSTILLSFITCIVMTFVNVPNFLTFQIVETPSVDFLPCLIPQDEGSYNSSGIENSLINASTLSNADRYIYVVLATGNDCMKLKLAFWSNGMLCKVVPCFLLTISIIILLKIIAEVAHRRKILAQVLKKKMPKDHMTPMLVAVLSIFLIAELPQGIMLVLTGIYSKDSFHQKIYLPLGDFMDLLSLINSAVNFLIYCVMSKKFRVDR
ncbi:unnamed protein product [Dracunculus medinensis]|uniref:G_PROTEIN_RECEP_F1_2 domain-containing protein n=1 Tax=Dracunculus medinensis TaxID=318479 RepID=A0A158Q6G5_DRAME|nr:unnamed protein product [Dracunculus medinensis]